MNNKECITYNWAMTRNYYTANLYEDDDDDVEWIIRLDLCTKNMWAEEKKRVEEMGNKIKINIS